jgi:hypothetical protein
MAQKPGISMDAPHATFDIVDTILDNVLGSGNMGSKMSRSDG